METEIEKFLSKRRRGVIMLPVEKFPYKKDISTSKLDLEETLYELAYLIISWKPELSRQWFQQILATQPDNKRS